MLHHLECPNNGTSIGAEACPYCNPRLNCVASGTETLPFFTFTDADAARRLRDRVAREIADTLDRGGVPAPLLTSTYRWLSQIADEKPPVQARSWGEPITGGSIPADQVYTQDNWHPGDY